METSKNRTIIIVDDQPAIRRTLSGLFSGEGYNVLTASNGLECIRIIREKKPDLVLMDLNMPMMDGMKTVAIIRSFEDVCNIPIAIITAYGDKSTVIEMKEKKVDDFIAKPFEVLDLLSRVAKILEKTDNDPVPAAAVPSDSARNIPETAVEPRITPDPAPKDPGFSVELPVFSEMMVDDIYKGMILGEDVLMPGSEAVLAVRNTAIDNDLIKTLRKYKVTSIPVKSGHIH
jgi:CheY-like chemotaxis protein